MQRDRGCLQITRRATPSKEEDSATELGLASEHPEVQLHADAMAGEQRYSWRVNFEERQQDFCGGASGFGGRCHLPETCG
jgi:hypothetical protein